MKTNTLRALTFAAGLALPACADANTLAPENWSVRLDLGGTIPESANLTLHDGPITSGDTMELTAGAQFNAALGYRLTPWLVLEGELGFSFNDVDSVGNWSYHDSSLTQLSLMANLVIELPRGPLVPFAGIGAGGVFSSLTFGSHYDYYYSESDGSGTDFVPAVQAFAGLRYEFSEKTSLGLTYRFLATDRQKWDVDWWTGQDFTVGVDSVAMHSISLTFTARF